LRQLLIDLAMGVDVLKMKGAEPIKIDIEFDFADDEEYIKSQLEEAAKLMQQVSEQTAEQMRPLTFQEMLGLTDDDVAEIKKALGTVMNEFNRMANERKRLADEAVSNVANQVSQTVSLLQIEEDRRREGLSNQSDYLRDQLKQQQEAQRLAIEEQKKASIMLVRMQQLEAAGAMVVAVANTFKAWSTLPGIGQVAAIAQIAAMLGAFKGYQQQIKSLKMERGGAYVEGGDRGMITGDRHSAPSGGEWLSNHIQAEAGEKVYVLPRKHSSGDGGKVMDSVFDAVQSGRGVSEILAGGARHMAPVINVKAGASDRYMGKLIKETERTNRLLQKWRFYNPVTGVEIDLSGNKRIYS
jgi:hypothetical protein